MTETKAEEQAQELVFEYELDARPEKVWRAISLAEFRDTWLPKDSLADPDAVALTPGQDVSYRMRDSAPPFLESIVTFHVAANESGGTNLRIVHDLSDARLSRVTSAAANSNSPLLMRAA